MKSNKEDTQNIDELIQSASNQSRWGRVGVRHNRWTPDNSHKEDQGLCVDLVQRTGYVNVCWRNH